MRDAKTLFADVISAGSTRAKRFSLAMALAAAGLLALAAAPASAATSHPFLTSFAGSGTNALTTPTSVAIDNSAGPAAGDVYVNDTATHRVEKFDAEGHFILMFGKDVNSGTGNPNVCTNAGPPTDVCQPGASGSAPGQFSTPAFLAVDSSTGPSAGDVYVGDTGTKLIQKFAPDGTLITSWGNSSPQNGQLNGSPEETFGYGPVGIAVDSSGNLEVLAQIPESGYLVFRFDDEGTWFKTTKTQIFAGSGFAIDAFDNFFNYNGGVSEYGSDGHLIGGVTSSFNATGVGVNTAADDLYVDEGAYIQRYHLTGSDQVVVQSDGSLCPIVPYNYQTGQNGCAFTESFGTDTTLTNAKGLAAAASGNLYVADTGNHRVAVFAQLPLVETGPASNITQTTATISGHVDPTGGGSVTSCHFNYGISGQTAACFDSLNHEVGTPGNPISGPIDVHADIGGLSANTSYPYQLVAANGNGIPVAGGEREFTTLPNPPTVTTTAGATGITPFAATVAGTVNPNSGNVSDCHFEYGETTAYSSQAACASLPGAGASPVGVSAEISGLSPSTTYHFRLVASNAGGTSPPGSDQEFTTLPPPPTVITTPGATGITQTAASVAGTVNPNLTNVADCHFEYGTNLSYGSQKACASLPGAGASPVGVSASLSGLTANTAYHFRLVATNAHGSTTYGSDQEFTTLPNPPTALATGTTATTQTAATLTGTVNPNSNTVSDCHIEYGATTSYGQSVACAPASPGSGAHPVDVSASLSGLATNTSYHFRVVATNAGGTTHSSDQEFTTLPNPPTVTTTAGATAITQTAASVAGTVNPNSGNVSDCHVEYGATASYGSQTACASLPGAGASPVGVSAEISGLSPSTTYHFRFVAANAGGTTNGSDQTFTTQPTIVVKPTCKTDPLLCPSGEATVPGRAPVVGGAALLHLSCAATAPCQGTLKLFLGKAAIGRASFDLAAGASKTVRVKLSRTAQRLLQKHGSLKAKVEGSGIRARTVKLEQRGSK